MLKRKRILSKGLLYKTTTYLCGAMEYVDGIPWRNVCLERYDKMGIRVFDPYNKPFLADVDESQEFRDKLVSEREAGNLDWVHGHMRSIRAYDLSCCDRVDFLTVYISNPKIASWGTAEEIYTANRAKKPIFITIEGGIKNTPLWLLGTLPPKYFYNTLDEMIEEIEKINNFETKIDSARWKLLDYKYR